MTNGIDHDAIDEALAGMSRRGLMLGAGMGFAALSGLSMVAPGVAAAHDQKGKYVDRYPDNKPKVGLLVYPNMVMQDLIGPLTTFNILGFENHLVWKDLSPVPTELKISVAPTTTFDNCPKDLDVLFAPGGTMGTIACMKDDAVLSFLADRGSRAKWVTSDCTGALIMGAAGLYKGYRATTLWNVMEFLPIFGITPVHERVVIDRNRMSGGGNTAGIDFGLTLGAVFRGEEEAKRCQLIMEYAPAPPFKSGTPQEADPKMVAAIKAGRVGMDKMVKDAAEAAAAKLA
ncbi:DJ-1/PfpI family protein [Sphingobium subterraneum]|uniref:Putative intracellular protease/amidase n=1 Tax=Sphingobium subterraneum TaxID=627688 RepID=A0A841IXT9_9SPHN|nr:DJ-1/PfpI family protein [Sphingobium subterraneum]MBB6123437.1 putative intracellular protease/amidase [Sphingobium subterraneum]